MKSKWFITLFAAIPFIGAMLFLQSCAGEGGPNGGGGGGGGGGSVTQEFLNLLPAGQSGATYIGSDACASPACHGGLSRNGDAIYTHWKETKHAANGVGCEKCHGPGSVHQAAPAKDNILTFGRSVSPIVCAQCHGKIAGEYDFSAHSRLIESPVSRVITSPGTARTSRCTSCHSGLFRAQVDEAGIDLSKTDPAAGGITDAQISGIAEATVKDLSLKHSADCGSCHNPHSLGGSENLNQNGEDVQLRHPVNSTDVTTVAPPSPGVAADPAKFTRFNHLCAQCHNGRGTDPSDVKLATESRTSRPGMHDSNQYQMLMGFGGVEGTGTVDRNAGHMTIPGQCTKCHMPDSRHSFVVGFKGCVPCHTESDGASRANLIKTEILDGLVSLKARMAEWALHNPNLLNEEYWNYGALIAEEGGTAPDQKFIPMEVRRARYNYWFITRSGDYGVHNGQYAKSLLKVANQEMDKLEPPVGRAPSTRSKLSQAQMLKIVEADRALARRADMNAND